MTIGARLRTVMRRCIVPEGRYRSFLLQLADLDHCNIFVDTGWNISCLLLALPCRLTNGSVDGIIDEHDVFDGARQAFLFGPGSSKTGFSLHHHILPQFSAERVLMVDPKQISTFGKRKQIGSVLEAKVDEEDRDQAEIRPPVFVSEEPLTMIPV
ncbi:hypothetical protein RJ55_01670 [Drechmeria coniospora]|nr:hypothetical protein RJ55_01670 [Drechmeria coniospora]